jgi:hypothetical protein
MAFNCPNCQRDILNRKRSVCEWCGSELPEDLLLSAEQIQKLAEQSAKEKAEHEKFMKKPSNTTSIPSSSVDLFSVEIFFD